MEITIDRDGTTFGFDVTLKFEQDVYLVVRHCGVSIVHSGCDLRDIDHHVEYLANKVLDIIEGN